MSASDAFLSPWAEALFSAVAVFGDAQQLDLLDVGVGQQPARRAIDTVIANALNCMPSVGSRIALIKGEAGSGKSHVLTTSFRRAAALPRGEVYPAVLQLTAPVEKKNYEVWLLDALFRQLTARHFADDHNCGPLRRLARRLLSRVHVDEQEAFLRVIDDLDDDGEVKLALEIARKVRKEALDILPENPPEAAFFAVVLLAGFGDSSAIAYLRQGVADKRLKAFDLPKIKTGHQRLEVLKDLGLTARLVGASLAIGFDQVENAVRLGSEDLFVHTIFLAVRIVENVPNCAVVVASVVGEYDEIISGRRTVKGLPAGDRDRIENIPPSPVSLDRGDPAFFRKVIAQRLAVMRARSKLPAAANALDPLPSWFLPRIDQARNVRAALREVSLFREKAIELQRLPDQREYETGTSETPPPIVEEDAISFDKLWADFMDSAPATINRLLVSTQAELLAWWAQEASREYAAREPVEVATTELADSHATKVVEVVLRANGAALERRRLAICEAPNRNQQLSKQIEAFLDYSSGSTPIVLRTNGFPKSRQSQVAGALHKLKALCGRQLDLGETEWHNLQRAKDFADRHGKGESFLAWRRDRQWLLQFLAPLQPLIDLPAAQNGAAWRNGGHSASARNGKGPSADHEEPAQSEASQDQGDFAAAHEPAGSFPVLIGTSERGDTIHWAPYQPAPNHLNNFGFLITGDAGSGKTQTIRVLIDAACREKLSLLIFDFKGDYCDPAFADPLGIEVVNVRQSGLPFNPLQPPPRGASGVQPIEHTHELAGVLARVFKLGPVQEGYLRDAINGAYTDNGIDPRGWIAPDAVGWPPFDIVLERLRDMKGTAALVTKLAPLCELGLFPSDGGQLKSFGAFIDKRVCLDLKELPTDDIKSALAELIIIQLHGYALRGDQPRRLKRVIVFDEAHRVRNSARLESLAREGRAFGVGIVIGTQFPGDIPETMAGNLATQLFLMNNQAEHRRFVVRQMYGATSGPEPAAMLNKLGRLKPFEGLFANAHHRSGVMLKVIPHYARRSDPGPSKS